MWFAPALLPDLDDPTRSYALLAQKLLPPGLTGLVLAGMFANTMSMTASDSNTISSVITRDILPSLFSRAKRVRERNGLFLARITTFTFTSMTLIIAINAESFGGVIGLIITWFGALVGPIAIPLVLGLLPWFRFSGHKAAIVSIFSGFSAFVLVKYFLDVSQATQIASPAVTSLFIYVVFGLISKKHSIPEKINNLFDKLK